jgi:hypothetical protein
VNKPLLALAGIALLGTAGVAGAVIVAPLGGEEEVVSQEQATDGATPTASPQADPEGWVRFSHPGTAEAPPFSFAYPGQLYLRGPQFKVVDPPDRGPQGTAVWLELFSWDPGTAPSYLGVSPLPPADAMYLKVFVGPYAPLEQCGPEGGEPAVLDGLKAWRHGSTHAPAETTQSFKVFAVTPDDCYALDTSFSVDGQWEEIFYQIVDSFRVDENSRVATPTPGPLKPVRASPGSDVGVSPAPAPEGFDTYVHPGSRNAPPFSFAYPANWFVDGFEAREGSNGFWLSMTAWDPNTPLPPEMGTGEIPANWVNVEIGVLPIGSTGQCTVEGTPQPAVLGSKAGWSFEGKPWPNVIAPEARAQHAGFCFWVSGWFSEPADPTNFDRITESFRFAE